MNMHLEKVVLLSTEEKWTNIGGNMTQRNVTSSFKFEIGERSIFSADFFHLDFSDKTVSA